MFPLVLITPEENHASESFIITELCLKYGITIHIRKPSFSAEAYHSYLSQYNNNTQKHFVLHEHHVLSNAFSVKGIHLKEKDRNLLSKEPFHSNIISTSFHHLSDFADLRFSYQYIFFSPLFESISKQHYGSDLTDDHLRQTLKSIKEYCSIPVVGLGGINEETIARVKESGFDGGALLGAVWLSEDPVKAFERIWEKVNAGRIL